MSAGTTEDNLLHARGVTVLRRHGKRVLNEVDCTLGAGEVMMLIGPNGAGKSTLLSTLAGDLQPASGQILLAGRELQHWPAAELAQHRAVLPQRPGLSAAFTVEEVVRLGCSARHLRPRDTAIVVDFALEEVDMTARAGTRVTALSGGEQARAHLARVLAQLWPITDAPSPRLLLLDEPCANLDPHFQHQVCGLVQNFARRSGVAVIITMHDMNLAAQYADRVLALSQGHCVAAGTPRDVLTRGFVNDCFGVDAGCFESNGAMLLATRRLQ